MFQQLSGSVHIDNIQSADKLREKCPTSIKAYNKLLAANEDLPVLDKVSHLDYLPNSLIKRN